MKDIAKKNICFYYDFYQLYVGSELYHTTCDKLQVFFLLEIIYIISECSFASSE